MPHDQWSQASCFTNAIGITGGTARRQQEGRRQQQGRRRQVFFFLTGVTFKRKNKLKELIYENLKDNNMFILVPLKLLTLPHTFSKPVEASYR